MDLRIENSHNLFSAQGFTGEKSVGNDKFHRQIVKNCLISLHKKGHCICYYDEQKQDIIKQFKGLLSCKPGEDEIFIEVIKRGSIYKR